jgi:hypothetical protein
MSLLDGGIARMVGNGLDFMMLDGALVQANASAVDEHGVPIETTTIYAFRGFTEDYTAAYRAMAGIPLTDIAVMIVASSTDRTPAIDDQIVIRGKTYRVRAVTSDPAYAMWACQCFEV